MNAILKNLDGLELDRFWSDEDASTMHRGAWLFSGDSGSKGSAVTYFEIDPGNRIGSHVHDAEETIMVLQSSGEVITSGGSTAFYPGSVVFVPEGDPHDVRNTSSETFRGIGFFPSAEVKTVFELVLQPVGTHEMGTSASG